MGRAMSPLAGQTVKIRKDVKGLGGEEYRVEDWWINAFGDSWMNATGNPAAMNYGMRSGFAGLPLDDDVLYGEANGLGVLVHVSEIEPPDGAL